MPAVRFAAIGCVMLSALACERSLAPRRSQLADLRQHAQAGVGTFYGRVRALDPTQSCWRATSTLAGIRVEVGLWDGNPAFYRDTLTREAPSTLREPRFETITSAVTDKEGRFRFDGLPRGLAYAFRAIPPQDSPWRLAYGATMYGIPNGGELADFPTLCLTPR